MAVEGADSQTLLNQIILEYMKEQKRRRRFRWGIRIILVLFLGYVLYGVFSGVAQDTQAKFKDHVGLILIEGEISDDSSSNADDFAKGLEAAYKNKGMKALVLRINSPGGSPVQADYMYNLIQLYRHKYKAIPIYSVCVDLCASAAYYVASASNEIYANPSSMVGSIGVLFNGFGFVDTLQKVGASRRLYYAGKNKAFLDPFTPVDPKHVQYLQQMLAEVHQTFIEKVKAGRGNKLKINDDTFSGLIWTGTQAKAIGLIDGFASPGQLIRDKIKLNQTVDYTYKKSVLDRFSKSINSAMANSVLNYEQSMQGIKLK